MNQGPLFCLPNFKPVTHYRFSKTFKLGLNCCSLNQTYYQSHSFKIGRASSYAEISLSDKQIRFIRRWESDSFKKYICCHRISTAFA